MTNQHNCIRSRTFIVMNRRSILTNFAILAVFLFPMGRTAEIKYDNCRLAELVTDSRLKINLQYNNTLPNKVTRQKYCWVTLKLPETRTMTLTIDNFKVSFGNFDHLFQN